MNQRLKQILRAPWVYLGAMLDRWYEVMPWRRRVAAGRRGEQLAARYLKRCGYLILARNYRAAGAEIDLVALDHATLVFVEVKLRSGGGFGKPEEAVDAEKRDRIRRAARAYAQWHRVDELPARFDVIAINGTGRACRLELVKNAF